LGAKEKAKGNGAEMVALDVEVENTGAFRLYKRLGYSVADESTVQLRGRRSFSFYRLCKELEQLNRFHYSDSS
jgi:ribosomal protein S18 acetylase RimI-like enzyme